MPERSGYKTNEKPDVRKSGGTIIRRKGKLNPRKYYECFKSIFPDKISFVSNKKKMYFRCVFNTFHFGIILIKLPFLSGKGSAFLKKIQPF